ncbi:DNA polymerase III subunit epsilon [Shewanella sp. Choline-02u-19]|jgi:DNA polymerase-3 subunit epsilon|uniref:DNA polymerase III subunit epsilon n=1 Tax=unclassified Shewanella TaxID=196818 RepID=UPI000C32E001|nr:MULTISPECIES: DNA polymerase III subunit epsilon [unclassified Shewanella]PKG59281.1 DNA polymerase III subunit epsilon [Shewanella sp. GutDb-MelDb]PKG75430.1 DNA polymerase III subunit epsilon [Shewanella sp. GutCb]PKH56150.1 DNA polymerase III subunit epsilon [Shewanella sp. Bg11-22]PKI27305.1 DNA polymerase III subunit epsilon [Shewanella sp. Choline-02u-19]
MNIISSAKRQIILDTETTGMNQSSGAIHLGHRIIEIGCVEVINRKLTGRHYHEYINPLQPIDPEAIEVHGITNEFVADKPKFHQIAKSFIEFIDGAEIVAHNASFDVSFMDHEFSMLQPVGPKTANICQILDSLAIAKHLHPGQKNNLDILCKRYGIDNSRRDLHGALLDAEILADVYLIMTGGQTNFNLSSEKAGQEGGGINKLPRDRAILKVISATADELTRHEERLDLVAKSGQCIWRG